MRLRTSILQIQSTFPHWTLINANPLLTIQSIFSLYCKKCYVGKVSRDRKTRISRHLRYLPLENRSNSLELDENKAGHNIDFTNATLIK